MSDVVHEERYLIVAGEALVHDVVEMHQEVTVGQHVLMFGHHLTDEFICVQLPRLELWRQHRGLSAHVTVNFYILNTSGK